MKTPTLILVLLTLFSNRVSSQQPSHFILGSEILSGTHIYDIYQGADKKYWVATNNGMYSYDGYDFKKYECNEMTSVSLFHIAEDYNSDIYFHNLSGQIFKIENDSCKLYFQIPEELMSNYFSFSFDNTNKLTIVSKKAFQVDENKKITILKNQINRILSIGQIMCEPDSTLVLFDPPAGRRVEIRDGGSKVVNVPKFKDLYPAHFYVKDKLIIFDKNTGQVYNDSILTDLNPDDLNMLSCQSDGEGLWLSVRTGGVHICSLNDWEIESSDLLFESSVISALLKDNEGNILLGTFGDGIIVIPNLDIIDLNVKDDKVKIVEVTADSTNIYLGAQNGSILKVNKEGKVEEFNVKSSTNIEFFEVLDEGRLIYNEMHCVTSLDLKTFEKETLNAGSLKSLNKIANNEYLLSSNNGLNVYSLSENSELELPNYLEPYKHVDIPLRACTSFKERTYTSYYDVNTECLYAGTSLGLKIGCQDSVFFFELNGHTVLCTDMIRIDDRIFISTLKEGVLIFQGIDLVDQWAMEQGVLSREVRQLKLHKNELYLSTKKGLQVLNLEGETLKTISASDGLHSNVIIDFELVDDMLWTITDNGVQRINLENLSSVNYKPEVSLHSLHVNDDLADTAKHDFSYFENKFVFNIKSSSLKYREGIYYKYQLIGMDKDWVTDTYDDHTITYKSLPEGEYVFKVKAVYEEEESETIVYPFIVQPKFWETWWFLLLVLTMIILVIGIIFKYQIRKQKIKQSLEKQLIESKLMAIQAQMNPHFIFNALNSIQDLVLRQKGEKAYNYISKFALLVRKILNHSTKDFIELDEEVELLGLYLELEKLRFKTDFSFEIEKNTDQNLEIPPMLIQPFIENGIKHGLFHKQGEKRLTVKFGMSNNVLLCEITDNGIGRKRANEIKQRKKQYHSSFSVESIETRFEILKKMYNEDLGVTFVDIEEKGETGTKVIVKVPFRRQF